MAVAMAGRATIDLVYFDAGGGHRAAAQALEAVIREQRRRWRVRLVHLRHMLDPQGLFRRYTGLDPEDLYNKRLVRGWTTTFPQELKVLQAAIRLAHPALVRTMQRHWLQTEPDLVVSLVPHFNRALHDSLSAALPGVPMVTVLTDLADTSPHIWIEPGQPQHVVCGTPRALAQARAAGYPLHRLHLTSGMILRPDFYRPSQVDRDAERRRLGLAGAGPVGVVLFGGHGARVMLTIARKLPDVPLVLMCGHNRALAQRLRALPAPAPRVVVEFTADVAYWLRLGDFFVGKPGPGAISEALHCGLPVIVTLDRSTMPQERYNVEWVREQGVGVVHPSFATVRAAAAEVCARLPELRERVRAIDNRAVFELPEILQSVLMQAQQALPQPLAAPVLDAA
jgi:UDP-N-acetylglucosamine:LPS N-acetylglucosamine transferase